MFYNVLKMRDLVDNQTKKIDKNVLLEHEESVLVILGLKKDEFIDYHQSERDACAYVLEGEVEFHFDAEKFNLKQGECILFKKNEEHKVLALSDSKFLLAKI